jgi:hypothetical protein
MRNIEGAIEERAGVLFCQPHGEAGGPQSAEIAASQTARLVEAPLRSQEPS